MEGRKGNERKIGSSSSSSSPNYRLKRTFLMGKRRRSTTPFPTWKMISSRSQTDGKKDFSMSARKLAAVLWEIDCLPPLKMEDFQNKERILLSSKGILDPAELCSCRKRGCRKLLRPCSDLGQKLKPHDQETNGQNNLKDVCKGLTTSKHLLELLSRVLDIDQLDCTTTTLITALKSELHRSCDGVSKLMLIQEQNTKKSETNVLLNHIKHSIVPSLLLELETEKKLRRKAEKLNKKAKEEVAQAVKEMETQKKARKKVEQVCEELVRGIWELKSQFANVREEVEKEREMFHLADLLREERMQMKLSDAKCLYEEQNAVVEKLRSELRRSNEVDNADNEDESDDDSDLDSIELSLEGISNRFLWGNGVENGSKRESVQHKVLQENQES